MRVHYCRVVVGGTAVNRDAEVGSTDKMLRTCVCEAGRLGSVEGCVIENGNPCDCVSCSLRNDMCASRVYGNLTTQTPEFEKISIPVASSSNERDRLEERVSEHEAHANMSFDDCVASMRIYT